MKLNMLELCAAVLAAVFSLGTGPLSAQALDGIRVKFAAPVVAASTTLPAGSYTIRVLPSQSESPVLAIEPENGGGVVVLAERSERPSSESTSVTLERHNGVLAITTVHMPDADYRLIAATHYAR